MGGWLLLCALPVAAAVQESPDLQLDEYNIVGRDTRIYDIAGGMLPTFGLATEVIALPDEIRSIEASQGLIGNDERLVRPIDAAIYRGWYVAGDVTSGQETTYDGWLRGSIDFGGLAASAGAAALSSDINTPTLRAPHERCVGGTVWLPFMGFRTATGIEGISGEDPSISFRGRDRSFSRFGGLVSLRTPPGAAVDITGLLRVRRGSWEDEDAALDDSGTATDASVSLEGEVFDMSMDAGARVDYVSFKGDMGSLFEGGAAASLLVLDGLGIRLGGRVYTFARPDEDTRFRIYPEVSFDWAFGRGAFMRGSFTPGVERRSFGDILDTNGLALPQAVLFEDTAIDIGGALGMRINNSEAAAVARYTRTDGALVFTRSGAFYPVLPGADVNRFSWGLTADITEFEFWHVDGEVMVTEADWNRTGEVPYVPRLTGEITVAFTPTDRWRIMGRIAYRGSQHVEAGSDDTVDEFTTCDIGVERRIVQFLDFAVELRNLTGAEGYWWSEPYEIPGAGLYAAIRGRY